VVPFKCELVTGSNINSLGSCNIVDIACHVLGGDVLQRVVVWWGTNVSSRRVSNTLINVVDPHVVDSGMGACH